MNYSVDFVLTHTAPAQFIYLKCKQLGIFDLKPDKTMEFLSELARKIYYRWWYFGHFHENWTDRLRKCRGICKAIDQLDSGRADWEPTKRKWVLYNNSRKILTHSKD